MLGMGWPEIMVCALVGFFVFGPERLPAVARDAARMVRQLRAMAQGAADDLKQHIPDAEEFGIDDLRQLRDLHPRRLLSGALRDDVPESDIPDPVVPERSAWRTVPLYDVDAT